MANMPHLKPARQADTQFTYLIGIEGWVYISGWIYEDGLTAHSQSPILVVITL